MSISRRLPYQLKQPRRLFVLSPANATGVRARMLLNPHAGFPLALQLRARGITLATAFTFASGLYFRGKITYANRFAESGDVVRVITSNGGLVDPTFVVRAETLAAFGEGEIDEMEPGFRKPFLRDATAWRKELGEGGPVILLGSIATPKYREVLLEVFGSRLLFPTDFVGRGDMSRGALLLRAAAAGVELPYQSVAGSALKGRRAPRVDSVP